MGVDRVVALFSTLFWFLSIVEAYDPFHYDPNDPCFRRCTRYYAPVCGSDGETYYSICVLFSIKCHRKDPNLSVAYQGRCRIRHPTVAQEEFCPRECPDVVSPVCGSDGRTYDNQCLLDAMACEERTPSLTKASDGYCDREGLAGRCRLNYKGKYKPVCGRDGKTYVNQGILQITACIVNDPNLAYPEYKGECEFTGRRRRRKCRRLTCDMNYDPVCGTDGKTYFNKCFMDYFACRRNIDTMRLLYPGVCRQEVVVLRTKPTRDPILTTPDGGRVTNLLPGPLSKSTVRPRPEEVTTTTRSITTPTTATSSTIRFTTTSTEKETTPSAASTPTTETKETTSTTSTLPTIETTPFTRKSTETRSPSTPIKETSPTAVTEAVTPEVITTTSTLTPSTVRSTTTNLEETMPLTTTPAAIQSSPTLVEDTSLTTEIKAITTEATTESTIDTATKTTTATSTPSTLQSTPTKVPTVEETTEIKETTSTISPPSTKSASTTLIAEKTSPNITIETVPTTHVTSTTKSALTPEVKETTETISTPSTVQSVSTTSKGERISTAETEETEETKRVTSAPSTTMKSISTVSIKDMTSVTEFKETTPVAPITSAIKSTPTTFIEYTTSVIEEGGTTPTTPPTSVIKSTLTTSTEDTTSVREIEETTPTTESKTSTTTSTPTTMTEKTRLATTIDYLTPTKSTPIAIQSTPRIVTEQIKSTAETPTSSKREDQNETTEGIGFLSTTSVVETTGLQQNATQPPIFETTTDGSGLSSSPTTGILSTTLADVTEEETAQLTTTETISVETTTVTTDSTTTLRDEAKYPKPIQQNETRLVTEETLTGYVTDEIASTTQQTVEVTSLGSTTEGSGKVTTLEVETTLYSVDSTTPVTSMPSKPIDLKDNTEKPSFLSTTFSSATTDLGRKTTKEPMFETTLDGSGFTSSQTMDSLSTKKSPFTMNATTQVSRTTEDIGFVSTTSVIETTDLQRNASQPPIFETTTESSGLSSSQTMDILSTESPFTMNATTQVSRTTEDIGFVSTTSVIETTGLQRNASQPPIFETTTESSGLSSSQTMGILSTTSTFTKLEETIEFISTEITPVETTILKTDSTRTFQAETITPDTTGTVQPTAEVTTLGPTSEGSGIMATLEVETDTTTSAGTSMSSKPIDLKDKTEEPSFLSTTPTPATTGLGQKTTQKQILETTSEGSGLSSSPTSTVRTEEETSRFNTTETTPVETTTLKTDSLTTTIQDKTTSAEVPMTTAKYQEPEQQNETRAVTEETMTAYVTDDIASTTQQTVEVTSLGSTTEGSGEVTTVEVETTLYTPDSLTQVISMSSKPIDLKDQTEEPSFLSTTSAPATTGLGQKSTQIQLSETTIEGSGLPSSPATSILSTTSVVATEEETTRLTTIKTTPVKTSTFTTTLQDYTTSAESATTAAKYPQPVQQNETRAVTEETLTEYVSDDIASTTQQTLEATSLGSTTEGSGEVTTFEDSTTPVTSMSSKPIDMKDKTEEPSFLSTTSAPATTDLGQETTQKQLLETTLEGSGLPSSPAISILSTTSVVATEEETTRLTTTKTTPVKTTTLTTTLKDYTTSAEVQMTTAKYPQPVQQNETRAVTEETLTEYVSDDIASTTQQTVEVTSLGSTTEGSGEVTTLEVETTLYTPDSTTQVISMSSKPIDLKDKTEEPSFLSTTSAPATTGLGQKTTQKQLSETTMEGSGLPSSPATSILSTTSVVATEEETTRLTTIKTTPVKTATLTTTLQDYTTSTEMPRTTAKYPQPVKQNETHAVTEETLTEYGSDDIASTTQQTVEVTSLGSTTEGSGEVTTFEDSTTPVTSMSSKPIDMKDRTEEPSFLSTTSAPATTDLGQKTTQKQLLETSLEGSGLPSSPAISILSTTSVVATEEETTRLTTTKTTPFKTTTLTTALQNYTTSAEAPMTTAKYPQPVLQNETSAVTEETPTEYVSDDIASTTQQTVEVTSHGSTTEGSGEVTTLEVETTLYTPDSTTQVISMSSKPIDLKDKTEEPSFLSTTSAPATTGLGQKTTQKQLSETTMEGSGLPSSPATSILSTTSVVATEEDTTRLTTNQTTPFKTTTVTTTLQDYTSSSEVSTSTAKYPQPIQQNETRAVTKETLTEYVSDDIASTTEQTAEVTSLGSITEGSGEVTTFGDSTTSVTSMSSKPIDMKDKTGEPSFLSTTSAPATKGLEQKTTQKQLLETTMEGSGLPSSPATSILSTTSVVATEEETTRLPTTKTTPVKTTTFTTTLQDYTTSAEAPTTTARYPQPVQQNETRTVTKETLTEYVSDDIASTTQQTVEVTLLGSTTEGSGEVTTLEVETALYRVDSATPVTSMSSKPTDLKDKTEEPSFLSTSPDATTTDIGRKTTQKPIFETTTEGSGFSSSPATGILSTTTVVSTEEETTRLTTTKTTPVKTITLTTTLQDYTTSTEMPRTTAKYPQPIQQNETHVVTEETLTEYFTDKIASTTQAKVEITPLRSTSEGSAEETTMEVETTLYTVEPISTHMSSKKIDLIKETEKPSFLRTTSPTATTGEGQKTTQETIYETTLEGSGFTSQTIEILSAGSTITSKEETTQSPGIEIKPIKTTILTTESARTIQHDTSPDVRITTVKSPELIQQNETSTFSETTVTNETTGTTKPTIDMKTLGSTTEGSGILTTKEVKTPLVIADYTTAVTSMPSKPIDLTDETEEPSFLSTTPSSATIDLGQKFTREPMFETTTDESNLLTFRTVEIQTTTSTSPAAKAITPEQVSESISAETIPVTSELPSTTTFGDEATSSGFGSATGISPELIKENVTTVPTPTGQTMANYTTDEVIGTKQPTVEVTLIGSTTEGSGEVTYLDLTTISVEVNQSKTPVSFRPVDLKGETEEPSFLRTTSPATAKGLRQNITQEPIFETTTEGSGFPSSTASTIITEETLQSTTTKITQVETTILPNEPTKTFQNETSTEMGKTTAKSPELIQQHETGAVPETLVTDKSTARPQPTLEVITLGSPTEGSGTLTTLDAVDFTIASTPLSSKPIDFKDETEEPSFLPTTTIYSTTYLGQTTTTQEPIFKTTPESSKFSSSPTLKISAAATHTTQERTTSISRTEITPVETSILTTESTRTVQEKQRTATEKTPERIQQNETSTIPGTTVTNEKTGTAQPTLEVTTLGSTTEGSGTLTTLEVVTALYTADSKTAVTPISGKQVVFKNETEEPSFLSTTASSAAKGIKQNATREPIFRTATEGSGLPSSTTEYPSTTSAFTAKDESTQPPATEITFVDTTVVITEPTRTRQDETTSPEMRMTPEKYPEPIQQNKTSAVPEITATNELTGTKQPNTEITARLSTTEGSGTPTTLEIETPLHTEDSTTAVTSLPSKPVDVKDETEEPSFLSTPPGATTMLLHKATHEPTFESAIDGSGLSTFPTVEIQTTKSTFTAEKEATHAEITSMQTIVSSDLPSKTTIGDDTTTSQGFGSTTGIIPELIKENGTTVPTATEQTMADYTKDEVIGTKQPTMEVTSLGSSTEGSGEVTTLNLATLTNEVDPSRTPLSSKPVDLKGETEEPSFLSTTLPATAEGLRRNATQEPISQTATEGSGLSSSVIRIPSTLSTFTDKGERTQLPATENLSDETAILPTEVTRTLQNETTSPEIRMTTAKSPELIQQNITSVVPEKELTDETAGTQLPTVVGTEIRMTTGASGEVTQEPLFGTTSEGSGLSSPTIEILFTTSTITTKEETRPTPEPEPDITPMESAKTEPTSKLQEEMVSEMKMMTKSPQPIQQNETSAVTEQAGTDYSTVEMTGTKQQTTEGLLHGLITEGSGTVTSLHGKTTLYKIDPSTTPMSSKKIDLKEETEELSFLSTTSPTATTGLQQKATQEPLFETTKEGSGISATFEILTTSTFTPDREKTLEQTVETTSFQNINVSHDLTSTITFQDEITPMIDTTAGFSPKLIQENETASSIVTEVLETTTEGSELSSSTIETFPTTSIVVTKEETTSKIMPVKTTTVTIESTSTLQIEKSSPGMDIATAKPPELIQQNETEKTVTEYYTDGMTGTKQPAVEVTFLGGGTEGSGIITTSDVETTLYVTDSTTAATPISPKQIQSKEETEEPDFLSTIPSARTTASGQKPTKDPIFETSTEGSGLSSVSVIKTMTTSPFTPKTEITPQPTLEITSVKTILLTSDLTTQTTFQDEETSGIGTTPGFFAELIQENGRTSAAVEEKTTTGYSADEKTGTKQPTVEVTLPGSTMEGSGIRTTLDVETTSYKQDSTTAGTPISPKEIAVTEERDEPGFLSTSLPTETKGLKRNLTDIPVLEITEEGSGMLSSAPPVLSTMSTFTVADKTDFSATTMLGNVTKSSGMGMTTAKPPGLIKLNDTIGTAASADSTDQTEGTKQPSVEITLFGQTSEGSGKMSTLEGTSEILSNASMLTSLPTSQIPTILRDKTTISRTDLTTAKPAQVVQENIKSVSETTATGYSSGEMTGTKEPTVEVTSLGSTSEGSGLNITWNGPTTSYTTDSSATDIPPTSPKQLEMDETDESRFLQITTSSTATKGLAQNTTEDMLFDKTMEGSGMSSSPLTEFMSATPIFTTADDKTNFPSTTMLTDITKSSELYMTTAKPPEVIRLSKTTITPESEKLVTDYSTDSTTTTKGTERPAVETTFLRSTSEGSGKVTTGKIPTSYSAESRIVTPTSSTKTVLSEGTEEVSFLRTTAVAPTTDSEQTTKDELLFETTMEGSGISSSPTIEILSREKFTHVPTVESTSFKTSVGSDYFQSTTKLQEDASLTRAKTTPISPEQIQQVETTVGSEKKATDERIVTKQPAVEVTSLELISEESGGNISPDGQTSLKTTDSSTTAAPPMSTKIISLKEETEEPGLPRIASTAETTSLGKKATEELLFETTMEGSGMSPSPSIEVLSTTSTFTLAKDKTIVTSITMLEDVTTPSGVDMTTAKAPESIRLDETNVTVPTKKLVTYESTDQTMGAKQQTEEGMLLGSTSSGKMTTSAGITTVHTVESHTSVTPISSKQMDTKETTNIPSFLRTTFVAVTTDSEQIAVDPEVTVLGSTSERGDEKTTMYTGEPSSSATPTYFKQTDLKERTQEPISQGPTSPTATTGFKHIETQGPLFETTFEGSGMSSSPLMEVMSKTSSFTTEKEITKPLPTVKVMTSEEPLFETTLEGSGMSPLSSIEIMSSLSRFTTTDEATPAPVVEVTSSRPTLAKADVSPMTTVTDERTRMDRTTARSPQFIQQKSTVGPTVTKAKATDFTTDEMIVSDQSTGKLLLVGSTFEGSSGMTTLAIQSTLDTLQSETDLPSSTSKPIDLKEKTEEPNFRSITPTTELTGLGKKATKKPLHQTTMDSSGQPSSPSLEIFSTTAAFTTVEKPAPIVEITDTAVTQTSSKQTDGKEETEEAITLSISTFSTESTGLGQKVTDEQLFDTTMEGSGMSPSPSDEMLQTTLVPVVSDEGTPTAIRTDGPFSKAEGIGIASTMSAEHLLTTHIVSSTGEATSSPAFEMTSSKTTDLSEDLSSASITRKISPQRVLENTTTSSPSIKSVTPSASFGDSMMNTKKMYTEDLKEKQMNETAVDLSFQTTTIHTDKLSSQEGSGTTPSSFSMDTEMETEGVVPTLTPETTMYTPSHTLVTKEKLGAQELQGKKTTTLLPVSKTLKSTSVTLPGVPTIIIITDKPDEVERHSSATPSEKPTEELGSGFMEETPTPTTLSKQSSTWFTVLKELEVSASRNKSMITEEKLHASESRFSTALPSVEISPSASAQLLTSLESQRKVTDDDSKVTELQEPSTRTLSSESKTITDDVDSSPTTAMPKSETSSSITVTSQQDSEFTTALFMTLSTRPQTQGLEQVTLNRTITETSTESSETSSRFWKIITTSRTPSRILSEQRDQNYSKSTSDIPENITSVEEIDSSTPTTAIIDIISEGINYLTNLTMTTLGGILTTSQPPVTASSQLYDSNRTKVPTTQTKSTLSRILEAASTPRSQTTVTEEFFAEGGSGEGGTTTSGGSQPSTTLFSLLRANRTVEPTSQQETTQRQPDRIRIPSTPPPPPPYPPLIHTDEPSSVDSYTTAPPSISSSLPTHSLSSATATSSFTSVTDLPVAQVATTEVVSKRTEEPDGFSGDTDGDLIAVPASIQLNQPGYMARIRECGQCWKEICPVCGTNGFTYQSECKLNQTACLRRIPDLQVAYQGECINGFLDLVKGNISCQEFECPVTYNPVCGSDNRTYTNSCELQKATICSDGGSSLEKMSDGVCKTNS